MIYPEEQYYLDGTVRYFEYDDETDKRTEVFPKQTSEPSGEGLPRRRKLTKPVIEEVGLKADLPI